MWKGWVSIINYLNNKLNREGLKKSVEISTLWKNKANQLEKLECAKAARRPMLNSLRPRCQCLILGVQKVHILTKAKRPIPQYILQVRIFESSWKIRTDILTDKAIASKILFDGVWCVQVIMPFPLFRNMMIMACKDS